VHEIPTKMYYKSMLCDAYSKIGRKLNLSASFENDLFESAPQSCLHDERKPLESEIELDL